MIVKLFFDFFWALISLVVGLFPTFPVPAWLNDANGYMGTVLGYGAGLGAWVPWPLVGTVFAAVMVCLGVSLGIKLVRIVASYLTLGGGSAG